MTERDSKEQKIGQLLDTLGVTMCLDEGDMVTDVVVIMKVLEQDGTVNIGMTKSEHQAGPPGCGQPARG